MALIKCPECGREVSDTAFKCSNCSYIINKPKRGITGIIFKSIFMIFNAIMILALILLIFSSTPNVDPDIEGTVKGLSTGMIFLMWLFIGLPLGIMSYITRAKS